MQPFDYEDYESSNPEVVMKRLAQDMQQVAKLFFQDESFYDPLLRETYVIVECTIATMALDILCENNIPISNYMEVFSNDPR